MIKLLLFALLMCANLLAMSFKVSLNEMVHKVLAKEQDTPLPQAVLYIIFSYHVHDFQTINHVKKLRKFGAQFPLQRISFAIDEAENFPVKMVDKFAALKYLSTLEIDVSLNDKSFEGIGAYLHRLLSKTELKQLRLDLNFHKITSADIQMLANMIGDQKKLECLMLSFYGCSMIGDDAIKLMTAISSLTNLELLRINFCKNNIDDSSAVRLLKYLTSMKGLTAIEIHLRGNAVTTKMMQKFENNLWILPKIRQLKTQGLDVDTWVQKNVSWEVRPNVEYLE